VQQIIISRKTRPAVMPSDIHRYPGTAAPKFPQDRAWFLFPNALSSIRDEEALHGIDEIT
jgi:hypothetical protein